MARGAPRGNQNAIKHGCRTARFLRLRADVMEELRKTDVLLARLYGGAIGQNHALPPPTGCDFMSSDMRWQGAGPASKISPRES